MKAGISINLFIFLERNYPSIFSPFFNLKGDEAKLLCKIYIVELSAVSYNLQLVFHHSYRMWMIITSIRHRGMGMLRKRHKYFQGINVEIHFFFKYILIDYVHYFGCSVWDLFRCPKKETGEENKKQTKIFISVEIFKLSYQGHRPKKNQLCSLADSTSVPFPVYSGL